MKFNAQKRIEAEKNGDKDEKVLYKFMNNAIYSKSMENVKNRIDVKLVSIEKHYLEWTLKPKCISLKVFDNDLVAIHKSKVTYHLTNQHMLGCEY